MTTSVLLLGLVPDWLSNWMTPIWILAAGITVGLLVLAVLWGLVWVVSRRAGQELWQASTEGVLQYVLWIAGGMVAIFVAGFFVVRTPGELLASVPRILATGTEIRNFEVSPADTTNGFRPEDAHAFDVSIRGDELNHVLVESESSLVLTAEPLDAESMPGDEGTMEVEGGVSKEWYRSDTVPPFGSGPIDQLYVYNLDSKTAAVRVEMETAPVHAVLAIPLGAIFTILFFLCFWGLRLFAPRVAAIALATAKSEIAQPLFLINVIVGCALLFVFLFIPYNTFGDDIKMLKDTGFILIMGLAILQAIWAGSTSLFEEVEGRTALTVLSKPLGRRQFILGKFFGIVGIVALLFLILGTFFLITVAYKPIYDARETAQVAPTWQQCHQEVMLTIPGLFLAFLETVVFVGLSVAISTRLSMLANFVLCFTIYFLGHITPLIVQSSVAEFEPVVFFGTLIATLLPVLDHFNIQAAVAAGVPVPPQYMAYAFLYCALYSAVALLLALALFEDRDLA